MAKVTQAMLKWWSDNGRKAGKIGGAKRSAALTPERRREIAQAAIKARWDRVRAREQDW